MQDWKALATKVIAVVIALRALMNLGKPFGSGRLVFFGKLLSGFPNLVLAPALGIFMLVLVYGMWRLRRFALPMSVAYSALVVLNILLFPVFQTIPGGWSVATYFLTFGFIGVAGAVGATWLLYAQRAYLT